jgi:hypothetical protein
VKPHIEIVTVPDVGALRVAAAAEPTAPVAPVAPPAEPAVAAARRIVSETLASEWPSAAVGPLARSSIELAGDSIRVRVVHVGAPLGPAAETLLSSTLSSRLEAKASIVDVAISPAPVVGDTFDQFVHEASAQAAIAASTEGVYACVRAPRVVSDAEAGLDAPEAEKADLVKAPLFALAAARGRLSIIDGERYELRLSLDACPAAAESAPADAGLASDAPAAPATSPPSADDGGATSSPDTQ